MLLQNTLSKYIFLVILGCSLIVSCSSSANSIALDTPSPPIDTQTRTIKPSRTVTVTNTPLPTGTTTSTATPSSTSTPPEPTSTSTVAETETLVEFKVPILLYHHVRGEKSTSRYQVALPDFKLQMEALHEMGYQTIPLPQFLDALDNGSPLPDNAIIITFDDGHLSVYENAFPIMKSFGFTGVFYIVANRIHDIPDFVNFAMLQEMMGAGWEIGSHSYTHSDLTLNHGLAYQEIARSKVDLEKALQTNVQTFAYPFGAFDSFLGRKVQEYGYQAGMGLGTSQHHTRDMKYYLNRIEIYGDLSLSDFKQIFIDS